MEPLYAGLIAALLTLFDLDRVFYIPPKLKRRYALYGWWWGFVVANGVLAGIFYGVLSELEALRKLAPWARVVGIGLGYRVLISAKLATISVEGRDIPIGPEVFYEKAKDFVFQRINRIAKEARIAEAAELAGSQTLEQLTDRAHASLLHDALLSDEQKKEIRAWIAGVVKDKSADESYKRTVIAVYILSGRRH